MEDTASMGSTRKSNPSKGSTESKTKRLRSRKARNTASDKTKSSSSCFSKSLEDGMDYNINHKFVILKQCVNTGTLFSSKSKKK